ncbi:MAG: hypothetical protein Q4D53_04195, partial [Leptotrichiaceae bacterium]|nr:hypothetical protein [Leptotrichiaceae bacterium]
FVDNQTTFIVGEGGNLTIDKVENTGAIIGKEGSSKVKINGYVRKDMRNHDTLITTGGSINLQTGKNLIETVFLRTANILLYFDKNRDLTKR